VVAFWNYQELIMPNLTIKGLPDELYQRLKRRQHAIAEP